MKKTTLFIGFLLSFYTNTMLASVDPPDLTNLLNSAQRNVEARLYKNAIDDYKELVKHVKSKGIYLYYISKYSMMIGDTNQFLQFMNEAITYSPQYFSVFKRDTLASKISGNLITQIETYYKKSITDHAWLEQSDFINIDTLRAWMKIDQFYRKEISHLKKQYINYADFKPKFDSVIKLQEPFDKICEKKLDSLIKRKGFPDLSNSVMEGLTIIHAIIQHCSDINKRQFYMKLCEQSIKKHNYPFQYYAAIIDRTLILENKEQEFGTEVVYTEGGEKKKLLSKEEEIELNNKRIIYGLSPIK